jgi:hypothetical protein
MSLHGHTTILYLFIWFIAIISLIIKCSLQYIYMYIVYSSVAMEGPFTLVKRGVTFTWLKIRLRLLLLIFYDSAQWYGEILVVKSRRYSSTLVQTYCSPSPVDAGDHGGAWLLPFPVWLQLGVRAALLSFLGDLFVPKIKLRERERVCVVNSL